MENPNQWLSNFVMLFLTLKNVIVFTNGIGVIDKKVFSTCNMSHLFRNHCLHIVLRISYCHMASYLKRQC